MQSDGDIFYGEMHAFVTAGPSALCGVQPFVSC